MKRLYKLLLTVLVLTPLLGRAQDNTQSTSFTLEQCIQYALENSINIKNANLDEEIALEKVKETTGIGLPQVTGNGSIVHNQKLARFFSAYNPQGGFLQVGKNPGIQNGDVIAGNNFFQLKNSGDASISVNQIIFSGSYIVALKASKAYKDLSIKTTVQTKEQTIMNVSKAFYAVLINKERTKLFENNIARVDSLLKNTIALNKNGFAEGIDVDRIRVTLNNLNTEREKFLNLDELSRELLKFQMNFPMDQPIDVSGNIGDIEVVQDLNSYNEGWDYKTRSDYKLLEANKKLQQLNLKNINASALPSLNAFANFGYSTQSDDIAGIFKTKTSFAEASDTLKALAGQDKWYSYSNFGLRLTVPIFSGFQQKHRVQQQKLALAKIDNNFKMLESSISLETKQATISYNNSLKSLKAQKENMELAGNVARITKIKYEQGVGSNLEVIDAESSLKESQVNFYSALYDVIVAKVDLDKAYGKLTPQTQTK